MSERTKEAGYVDATPGATERAVAAAAMREAGKVVERGAPHGRHFCKMRPVKQRVFGPGVTPRREALINLMANKWVNGTTLRYYFFDKPTDGETVRFTDGTTAFVTYMGHESQKKAVRDAFKVWADVGIGIGFKEVADPSEAEVRIGFMEGDGSWSWLGRDVLKHPSPTERTMNIGWDISGDVDTAVHEIGHTLGFPHEHQNPTAGTEWNEEAVYAALAQDPNNWDRETTFWNIIRKLPAGEVDGTTWDPDSVMHYPFEKGLIRKPETYANGLFPRGGLSDKDKQWSLTLYPKTHDPTESLEPAKSVPLALGPGEQKNLGGRAGRHALFRPS